MGRRLLGIAVVMASLATAAAAFAMVNHVPASAFVVPSVRIAAADGPIRIAPADLGAHRTERGLSWDEERLAAKVAELQARFNIPAQPGRYELNGDGVLLKEGVPGRELDPAGTREILLRALKGARSLSLPLRDVPAPAPPQFAIVVRLADFRLELFEGPQIAQHFEVGVGALRFPTPPGAYYVKSKAKNPTWRNPGSNWSRSMPAFIPAGPRNPLGTRALRLDRDALVIHGTPNPSTVGRRSSHGCIRMRKADVESLFEIVPVATPVFIVP